MKQFRDDVRLFFDGEIDEVARIIPSKADMKKIRREYQLFGKTTTDLLQNADDAYATRTRFILEENRLFFT